MYESSDKDEEGKRQGTRKSEADEEDDDYPAANSLDLIKICFVDRDVNGARNIYIKNHALASVAQ